MTKFNQLFSRTVKANYAIAAPPDEPRFLECFKSYYDRAAALSHHSAGVLQDLKSCRAILRVEFPVKVILQNFHHFLAIF